MSKNVASQHMFRTCWSADYITRARERALSAIAPLVVETIGIGQPTTVEIVDEIVHRSNQQGHEEIHRAISARLMRVERLTVRQYYHPPTPVSFSPPPPAQRLSLLGRLAALLREEWINSDKTTCKWMADQDRAGGRNR